MRYPVTLFVGAGASRPFGYPVCSSFLNDTAAEELRSHKGLRWLLKALGSGRAVTAVNVEELLELSALMESKMDPEVGERHQGFLMKALRAVPAPTAAQLESQRSGLLWEPFWTYYQEMRGAMGQLPSLSTELHKTILDVFSRAPSKDPASIYGPLFLLLEKQMHQTDFPVFTTNYDRVLEDAMDDDAGAIAYTGFGGASQLVWSARNYEPFFVHGAAGRRYALYKLHGSVGWSWSKGRRGPHVVCGPPNRQAVLENHILLYPAYKGIPTEEIFRISHDALAKVLLESSLCIALGFSFQDHYINIIFSRALEENGRLKMLLVEPDVNAAEGTIRRLSRVGISKERIKHIQGAFGADHVLRTLEGELDRFSGRSPQDETSNMGSDGRTKT